MHQLRKTVFGNFSGILPRRCDSIVVMERLRYKRAVQSRGAGSVATQKVCSVSNFARL